LENSLQYSLLKEYRSVFINVLLITNIGVGDMDKKIIYFSVLLILVLAVGIVSAAAPEITQFNYTPSPAVPGSTITILAQIENKENQVKEDVIIKIGDKYPFTVVEENEINLGSLDAQGKALATFTVYVDPSAENSTYTIPIQITTKQNDIGKTTNESIIISGKEPIIKVIDVSDEKLIPGQEKEITLTVQNIGTSSAYDVTVELQEDRTVISTTGAVVEREITPLGAALAYFDKLNPKETKDVTIKVSVNREAELKNYTLPVKVSYRNSAGTRTEETSYIGFKVSGNVIIDLSLKEATQELYAGSASEITIELFNKGVGKAEFTIVELEVDFGTINKPKQFIGALEPNDVDSFKTTINVDPTIETRDAIIKTTISYQDTDATNKTIVTDIPVKIYSATDTATKNANPIGLIINIVIIIVILFVIWKGYKKIKK